MTATVFPPNSPEPPPEIRVVRYDGVASTPETSEVLFERNSFNLWQPRGASHEWWTWGEMNHDWVDANNGTVPVKEGKRREPGSGYTLTEVEEFTTAPVTA